MLVHLGSSNYLDRYKVYVAHVKEWRQQFGRVDSVDLRYDRQIIVNPDSEGVVKQATISTSAAKEAIAASVKPAAFTSHETKQPTVHHPQSVVKPAVQKKSLRTSNHSTHSKGVKKPVTLASGQNKSVNQAQTTQANAHVTPPAPVNVAAQKKPSAAIAKQQ